MTRAINPIVAEIERRYLVIPFDSGPASGILVGAWRPVRRYLDIPPGNLKNATLYYVRDGRPGAVRVPGRPCPDPAGLDVASLYHRAMEEGWGDGPTRMPERVPFWLLTGDPFVSLAWGHRLDYLLAEEIGREISLNRSSGWSVLDSVDHNIALGHANTAERMQTLSGSHFAGRMDAASRSLMTFMSERLPYFSWATFRALADEGPDGPLRRFSEAFPLLAGRGLSSPDVVARARDGDMDGARAAALDPALLGGWVVEAVQAHPHLARVVDGRRRGRERDKALSRVRFLDARTVPDTAEGFAAYVDAHAWSEAVGGFRSSEGWHARISRMRGNWGKAIAGCEKSDTDAEEIIDRPSVRALFDDMTLTFESDLLRSALILADGLDGPKVRYEKAMREPRPFRGGDDILYRGMNVPDRARHALRYAKSRAQIKAVGPGPGKEWVFLAAPPFADEWLEAPDGTFIKFTAMGSPLSLNMRCRQADDHARKARLRLTLSASTPDGRLGIEYVQRGVDDAYRKLRWTNAADAKALALLARAYGVPVDDNLGNVVLARCGLVETVVGAATRAHEARRAHLAALQEAWGDALPRRLRKLSPETFASVLAAEYEAQPGAQAIHPDIGPGDFPLTMATV